jgi:cysteine desulfurase
LYVRKGVQLEPVVYGGGQEKDLRSGTENVPGVVGFARALELAHKERVSEFKRLVALRDYFIAQVLKKIPKATVNGPADVGVKKESSELNFGLRRLPNNINLQLQAEGEAVMLYLDAKNIATATGSACATDSADPSHVLKAIGLSDAEAKSSLRITLGKSTTKQQLNYVLKVLPKIVKLVANM